MHPIDGSIRIRGHAHHAVIDHIQIELTPDAAVGTGRCDLAIRSPQTNCSAIRNGSCRTISRAGPTPLAAGVLERNARSRLDMRFVPSIGKPPHEPALHLVTGPDTARTQDALIEIDMQKRTGIGVDRVSRRLVMRRLDLVLMQQSVEFRFLRMLSWGSKSPLSSQQPQHHPPGSHDLRRMSLDGRIRHRPLLAGRD
jgi:hypothetical protein